MNPELSIQNVQLYFKPVRKGKSNFTYPEIKPFLQKLPQEWDYVAAKNDLKILRIVSREGHINFLNGQCYVKEGVPIKGLIRATYEGQQFTDKLYTSRIVRKDAQETWEVKNGKLTPEMTTRLWDSVLAAGAAINQIGSRASVRHFESIETIFCTARASEWTISPCFEAILTRLTLA